MSDQSDLFGTDPYKLHRREAPDTSVAAAYRVDTKGDEQKVYEYIANHGPCTIKAVARSMGKQLNQISGRITALLDKELIEDTGDRADGCRVYRTQEPDDDNS